MEQTESKQPNTLRNITPATALCICGALISFALCFRPLSDPDMYWHIKSGEWIYVHHAAATYDVFNWIGIQNHLKWVNHEWLFDFLIFLVHKAAGLIGVKIFTGLVGSALYVLLFTLFKKKTNNKFFSVFLSMFAIIALLPFIVTRPQIISFCFFVLFSIFLENSWYYRAIPIVLIGTNMHGGVFPIYLLLGVYYLFRRVSFKKALSVIALYMAATCINPYFLMIYWYSFVMTLHGSTGGTNFIAEWQPVTPISYLMIILGYCIIILFTRRSKMEFKDAAALILFGIFSLVAWRHIVFLFLIALPISSRYMLETLQSYESEISNSKISKPYLKVKGFALGLKKFSTSATTLYLLIILIFLGCSTAVHYNNVLIPDNFPTEAVQYIKEHKEIQNIFNDYGYGGFLIYNGIKTFMDGRADIYTQLYNHSDLLTEFMSVYYINSDYHQLFQKYHIQYALLKKSDRLAICLKNDTKFKVIYEDENFEIFKQI